MTKNFCELYKWSLEKQNKDVETNLMYQNCENNDDIDLTHLDIEDYLVNLDDEVDYFIDSSSK